MNTTQYSNSKLEAINKFYKTYDNKILPYQFCELCYKSNNLIICDICKCFYHIEV